MISTPKGSVHVDYGDHHHHQPERERAAEGCAEIPDCLLLEEIVEPVNGNAIQREC